MEYSFRVRDSMHECIAVGQGTLPFPISVARPNMAYLDVWLHAKNNVSSKSISMKFVKYEIITYSWKESAVKPHAAMWKQIYSYDILPHNLLVTNKLSFHREK